MKQNKSLNVRHDGGETQKPDFTVLMIHGIASDARSFEKTWEYLEGEKWDRRMRFVAVDLLGSGDSEKSDELDYDYGEQLAALHNTIVGLGDVGKLILVGHSMGTLVATRYANDYPHDVAGMVLVSPPIYTVADLDNPMFETAMNGFKMAVAGSQPELLSEKSFNASIENIVKNRENYDNLCKVCVDAALIYGEKDEIIASYNIPAVLKKNPKISAVRTEGRHGIDATKNEAIKSELNKLIEAGDAKTL